MTHPARRLHAEDWPPRGRCQWLDGAWAFCACRCTPGSSYCAAHEARAWRSSTRPDKRERAFINGLRPKAFEVAEDLPG